jgi:hypothetical protein
LITPCLSRFEFEAVVDVASFESNNNSVMLVANRRSMTVDLRWPLCDLVHFVPDPIVMPSYPVVGCTHDDDP